jgi:hypothetical protein
MFHDSVAAGVGMDVDRQRYYWRWVGCGSSEVLLALGWMWIVRGITGIGLDVDRQRYYWFSAKN